MTAPAGAPWPRPLRQRRGRGRAWWAGPRVASVEWAGRRKGRGRSHARCRRSAAGRWAGGWAWLRGQGSVKVEAERGVGKGAWRGVAPPPPLCPHSPRRAVAVSALYCGSRSRPPLPVPPPLPPPLPPPHSALSEERPRALSREKTEAPLQRQAVAGELVVGGEAGRVGRAGGLPGGGHLLRMGGGEKRRVRAGRGPPPGAFTPPPRPVSRYLQGVNAIAALIVVALQEHGAAALAQGMMGKGGRSRAGHHGKGGVAACGVGGVAPPGAA